MPIHILTATPSSLGVTYDYKGAIVGFVVFVALILLSYFVSRRFLNRTIGGARHLRVIERLGVSRDVSLMIVEVGQKILAVSVTKEGLRLLCELSTRDIATLNEETKSVTIDSSSTFLKRFWHNMRIQMGLLPKNTPPARPAEPEEAAPAPSSFAMALLRAQAEDNRGALMELLEKKGQLPEIEARTDAEPAFSEVIPEVAPKPAPLAVPEESPVMGDARDYNAAIESLKQMGKIETPVIPVATNAAAAAYKTAPLPKPSPSKPAPLPMSKPNQAGGVSAGEVKQSRSEDRVDELFDRISKRSNRYVKKGKD